MFPVFAGRARYAALANRIARSGADGVLLGGWMYAGGDKMAKALRARLGRRVAIIATDAYLPVPDLLKLVGPSILGAYVSFGGLVELPPPGRQFMRALAASQPGGTIPAGTYIPETA